MLRNVGNCFDLHRFTHNYMKHVQSNNDLDANYFWTEAFLFLGAGLYKRSYLQTLLHTTQKGVKLMLNRHYTHACAHTV